MITTIAEYKAILEKKRNMSNDLLIVDVQPDFKRFFNDKFLMELKKYCHEFGRVFQIWDNTNGNDIYRWPYESVTLEKTYGGELVEDDIDYYLSPEIAIEAKATWDDKEPGWHKETKNGDAWMFIGGSHKWFYINKDMLTWVKRMAGTDRMLTLVGGADNECLYDIEVMLTTFGVKFKKDSLYVYSAKGCRFVIHKPEEELVQDSLTHTVTPSEHAKYKRGPGKS